MNPNMTPLPPGYTHVQHTFEPVFDEHSRILILGSFPSVKSREIQFYYGHPQNRFWKLMAQLLDVPVPQSIDEKKDASYRHMLEQYLASINRSVKPFLEIGSTEFIIHMLLKNTGISFLPKFTVQRELQQKQLTALNVRGFQMQTWRQIFYHKNKWVTREMQEFLRLADKMS